MRFAGVLFLLATGLVGLADAAPLTTEQQTFIDAEKALDRGALQRFERLAASLEGYPLHPYLQYAFMRRYISSRVEHADVVRFLEQWGETPLADRLREAWLRKLASGGRWTEYLELYREELNDAELACLAARGELALGRKEEAMQEAARLWTVGKSQHRACDPLFSVWIEEGGATAERAWERIGLAMENGRLPLTDYLSRFLPQAERPIVSRWQRVHRRPGRELKRLRPEDARSGELFAYGVSRLAWREPLEADRIWRERGDEFPMEEADRARTARTVGLVLARERRPEALERLSALPREWHDGTSRGWWLRAALWQQNWEQSLAALEAFPPEEREDAEWLYWRARTEEALGNEEAANGFFRQAAECRCYYGFLAAGRAGSAPRIDTVPLAIEAGRLESLAAEPAMRRIRELLALSREVDARREWWAATRDLPEERLRVAARLAGRWGWHDQVILTLGRTEFLDDLELRFPTPYTERVSREAERRELDTAFVYAIMRQESAFFATARSPVGALGLMQLMPATARLTARRLKQPEPGYWEILSVDNNIRLGTAHLRHLLDRYHGNRLYTAAAYNAGPHRVTAWLPKEKMVPGDIWVACLPFRETREYVKRIYAYTLIYEWRLGREPTPVSVYLPEAVLPRGSKGEMASFDS